MSSYLLTPQAVQDLNEIHDFIASDHPTAALNLLNILEAKFKVLASDPEIGRVREELAVALRSFPTGNYVIFYRIIKEAIQVIRVLHGARDMDTLWEEG